MDENQNFCITVIFENSGAGEGSKRLNQKKYLNHIFEKIVDNYNDYVTSSSKLHFKITKLDKHEDEVTDFTYICNIYGDFIDINYKFNDIKFMKCEMMLEIDRMVRDNFNFDYENNLWIAIIN